jgi:hypothetical protein
VTERKPNIFLEIVSHLPFEFAILNLDRGNHRRGALTRARLLLLRESLSSEESMSVKKSTGKTPGPNSRLVATKPAALEPMTQEPMDMQALREHLGNLVRADAANMVNATIGQAHDGHYQAMKYLFEMVGLFPATAMVETPKEDSLAGMLLSRLGIQDETSAEGEEANHVK